MSNKRTLVPKLRFPEFQDSGKWRKRKIEEFLTESRLQGSTGDIAQKLTVKLWGKGVFKKDEIFKGSPGTQYYRRKAGQFIYSKLDFLNQAFGIIPEHLDGFESTVDLPCFDISTKIYPVFLLKYVKRNEFYKKLGEIADGGRKAKRIQVDTFLSFPILIPPQFEEQQKIADCLSSLDELITLQTQKLEVLKNHKKGLILALFPIEGEALPKLRFQEFRVATGWKKQKVSSLLTRVVKPVVVKLDEMYQEIGIRSHGKGLFHKKLISGGELGTKRVFWVEENAFIVNIVFAWERAIAVTSKFEKGMIASHRFPMFKAKENKCDVNFIKYFFLTNNGKYLLGLASPGGAGRNKTLGQKEFEKLELLIPERVEEQIKIANFLTSLDELIALETQMIDTLKAHKKGLMQQLFPSLNEE